MVHRSEYTSIIFLLLLQSRSFLGALADAIDNVAPLPDAPDANGANGANGVIQSIHFGDLPFDNPEFSESLEDIETIGGYEFRQEFRRHLSEALPNGGCQITISHRAKDVQTAYAASYPGSGARMTWSLLEALSGLWTGDDWDNNKRGKEVVTVKTHYPHHAGRLVDWDDEITRALVIIRNPMQAIPSFFNHIYEIKNNLAIHSQRAPVEAWIEWRDEVIDLQIKQYAIFVNYWMNRFKTLNNDRIWISYERLTSWETGPEEATRITQFLGQSKGVEPISLESVPCVWKEVVKYKDQKSDGKEIIQAIHHDSQRSGPTERPYTPQMLLAMSEMLTGLIEKWGEGHKRLASILEGYQNDVHQAYLVANQNVPFVGGVLEEVLEKPKKKKILVSYGVNNKKSKEVPPPQEESNEVQRVAQESNEVQSAEPGEGRQVQEPVIPILHQATYAVSFPGSGDKIFSKSLVESLTGLGVGEAATSRNQGRVIALRTRFPHSSGQLATWDDEIPRAFVILRNPLHAIPTYFNHLFEVSNHLSPGSSTSRKYAEASQAAWIQWREKQFLSQVLFYQFFVTFWMERYEGQVDNLLHLSYESLMDEATGPQESVRLLQFLEWGLRTNAVQAANVKFGEGVSQNNIEEFVAEAVRGLVPVEDVGAVWNEVVSKSKQPSGKNLRGQQLSGNNVPKEEARRSLQGVKPASKLEWSPEQRPYTPENLVAVNDMLLDLMHRWSHNTRLFNILARYQAEVNQVLLEVMGRSGEIF